MNTFNVLIADYGKMKTYNNWLVNRRKRHAIECRQYRENQIYIALSVQPGAAVV